FVGAPGKSEFDEAIDYRLVAHGGVEGTPFPKSFAGFEEHGVRLIEPTDGQLHRGVSQTIAIMVPGARKVEIIVGERWTPLTQRGDRFVGDVVPTGGTLKIVAAFGPPSSGRTDHYETLLEYQIP